MHTDVQHAWVYPESIAVATDLSDLEYLLPHAKAQAAATGAALWLVHVIPPEIYVSPASGAYPCSPKEQAYRKVEKVLEKEADCLRKEGLRCEYEIRRWFAAEQIAAFIHQKKIGRLIIGTSGKSKLGKLLLGSVAEDLIRTVDIPVCTIGPHVRPKGLRHPRHILYASSLRHEPEASLQFAVAFAAAHQAELTILHVIEHSSIEAWEELDARVKMSYLVKEAAGKMVQPQSITRLGDPADQILHEAEDLQPDLLILGAVPTSSLAAMAHTGVAYELIAKSPCPVLTLRESLCATCGKHHALHADGKAAVRASY